MFFFVIIDLPIHLNTKYLIYLSMHACIHLAITLYFFYAYYLLYFVSLLKHMEDAKEHICSVYKMSPGKPSTRISFQVWI